MEITLSGPMPVMTKEIKIVLLNNSGTDYSRDTMLFLVPRIVMKGNWLAASNPARLHQLSGSPSGSEPMSVMSIRTKGKNAPKITDDEGPDEQQSNIRQRSEHLRQVKYVRANANGCPESDSPIKIHYRKW
jgi:hypothetical protein